MTEAARIHGESSSVTQDIVNNRMLVKAYCIEENALEWSKNKINEYVESFTKAMTMLPMVFSPSRILTYLPPLLVCGVGLTLVTKENMKVQTFIMIFTLSTVVGSELNNIDAVLANLPELLAKAERLVFIWDIEQRQQGTVSSPKKTIHEVIKIENVRFSYKNEGKKTMVLQDFSLRVKKGEKVALVGISGCGKSTVLKLISGSLLPESGKIEVLGENPRNYASGVLPNIVSFIGQEVFLFPMSIKENILMANSDVDDKCLEEVLISSNLINSEENLDIYKNVGESGIRMSGGQKQMISIARLLLQDPEIILLDEVTSALDNKSERYVKEVLDKVGAEKTVLMVSHKLSEIIDFDRILVMDKGKIIEEGSHEQLLIKGGLYSRIWKEGY